MSSATISGYSQRVLYERMPVLAQLVLHGLFGYAVGFEYLLLLVGGIAVEDGFESIFGSVHFLSFMSSYISSLYLAAAGKSRALAASSISS